MKKNSDIKKDQHQLADFPSCPTCPTCEAAGQPCPQALSPEESQEFLRELQYLRKCTESTAAKVLSLDTQTIAIRHELEQKRRGFSLMAELAVTLGQDADYEHVFVSVSKRINAALNMQRTAVLVPESGNMFKPVILRGYQLEDEIALKDSLIPVPHEIYKDAAVVLATGAEPEDYCAGFRAALKLPYLIAAPVVLHDEVVAVLVTGRIVEQSPFLPRLGRSDQETVQTVSAYLGAMLAGQRMAETEERAQIMFNAMPLCCTFWDENFNNLDCNDEAMRLFGVTDKQEFLENFGSYSPEFQPDGTHSKEALLSRLRETYETGYARFEWLHRKADGELIPAEVILVRVRRHDKYIIAGYARDLRELKAMLAEMRKTEEQLRLARDLAEESARVKSEFLANMSHEIRTPMNAIMGMTHLLTGTPLNDKQQMYVDQAAHSAQLLMHIINDILDFSKIEAGKMDIENISFAPRLIAENVRDIIRPQASNKGLCFELLVRDDVPEKLDGDPMRLEQVMLNIAGNAIKFTYEGSVRIEISTKELLPDGRITLLFEVADTGIGMAQEQIAALFTPFTQADTSMTRKYGGTGLGLAISRNLVNLMQGVIWCESELGRGSKFFFTATFGLPGSTAIANGAAANSNAASITETDQDGANDDFSDLAGLDVLLVEDNEINQMIATELLTSKDVNVDVANNGREGISALLRKKYDIVLMDIQMPEMDGLEATVRLRDMPEFKSLPIVAMTAHAMSGDREVSLNSGMNDHLTKPIDPLELYAALRKWGRKKDS